MKIVFICGSLEPGRSGVGDYTRILGSELIHKGHETGLLAINDPHVRDKFEGTQEFQGIVLPVLRLPSNWPSIKRFEQASLWINQFDAEWLSIQFVPFSFHVKGLPFGIGRLLRTLGKNRKWHIMFHELWVGMHRGSSKKELFWGYLQRKIILSLIKKLQPQLIHTQSTLYKMQLAKRGTDAVLLSLFSNIPVSVNYTSNTEKKDKIENRKEKIVLLLFGMIHTGAPVESFASEVRAYSKKTGIQVSLVILGHGGSEQSHWERIAKNNEIEVQLLGEQSAKRISQELSNATLGISTTPLLLLEKSGSVAAMLQHGLPVLCVARAWQPKNIPSIKLAAGINEYQPGKLAGLIENANRIKPLNNISDIGDQFINDLTSV